MSQDTEQSQQSPREIAEKLHRKIKRFIDADRHHYEPSGLYEIVAWIADAIESERESLAAKDREIAELQSLVRDVYAALGPRENPTGDINDDLRNVAQAHSGSLLSISALQKENASLKEPPPVESWKDLVRLAYKEDPDNGALRINQITGHYNAMEQQRDALAEALKEVPNLPKVMDPGASDKWKEAYETAINDVRVLFSTKLASVDEQKQETPK